MKQILFFLLCIIVMAGCSEDKTERDELIQKAYKAGQNSVFEVMDSVHGYQKKMIQTSYSNALNQFQALLIDTSSNELRLQKLKEVQKLQDSLFVIIKNVNKQAEVNSTVKYLVDNNKPYVIIAER